MSKNVGRTDSIIRLVLAVAAVLGALAAGVGSALGIVLLVVAAIMVATAFTGFCPLYRLVGMNTCRTSSH